MHIFSYLRWKIVKLKHLNIIYWTIKFSSIDKIHLYWIDNKIPIFQNHFYIFHICSIWFLCISNTHWCRFQITLCIYWHHIGFIVFIIGYLSLVIFYCLLSPKRNQTMLWHHNAQSSSLYHCSHCGPEQREKQSFVVSQHSLHLVLGDKRTPKSQKI